MQLLVRRLRRVAYAGVLGAPLLLAGVVPLLAPVHVPLLEGVVPLCQNTCQLCLAPCLPLLWLSGTARLFLRILEGSL